MPALTMLLAISRQDLVSVRTSLSVSGTLNLPPGWLGSGIMSRALLPFISLTCTWPEAVHPIVTGTGRSPLATTPHREDNNLTAVCGNARHSDLKFHSTHNLDFLRYRKITNNPRFFPLTSSGYAHYVMHKHPYAWTYWCFFTTIVTNTQLYLLEVALFEMGYSLWSISRWIKIYGE